MNPVNATALFVSAARSVLQCDPRDPLALAELCKLLPFFRQSLSCLVCGKLLCDPIAPVDSSCQHYVCLGCKGQRMQLRPSCSWCKDYSRFEQNRQLALLVCCYRRLCAYVAQSPLAPHVAAAASDSPDLQAALSEGQEMAQEQEEAEEEEEPHIQGPLLLSVEEVLRTLDPPPLNGLVQSEPAPVTLSQSQPAGPAHRPQLLVQSENSPVLAPFRCHRKRSRSESDSQQVAPVSLSVLREPKADLHTTSDLHLHHDLHVTPASLVPNGEPPRAGKTLLLSKPLRKPIEHHGVPKKSCAKARQQQQGALKPPALSSPASSRPCPTRCHTRPRPPNPSTRRPPRRKACLDCICRGCQNSYMANGEKKLEAFAVPEKALEQTRLTLGINLSSITALRNPVAVAASPGNALIAAATGPAPVTAASFHENRVFDWSSG
ncbi:hypothetical protein WMY93_029950 [Mugilogobius chulae]|uniref:E3 ubiquitin-protein ligase MSL2 n=1 Tax=Mugilogobius chulae TaxID=88201 RepID=A0AAW0MY29_9GOBI